MGSIRNLLAMVGGKSGGRFNRYYTDLVNTGAGYPTADEVRKDMIRHYESVGRHAWTVR
jgi:hypothetical protein